MRFRVPVFWNILVSGLLGQMLPVAFAVTAMRVCSQTSIYKWHNFPCREVMGADFWMRESATPFPRAPQWGGPFWREICL